jgi:hypothetical protein
LAVAQNATLVKHSDDVLGEIALGKSPGFCAALTEEGDRERAVQDLIRIAKREQTQRTFEPIRPPSEPEADEANDGKLTDDDHGSDRWRPLLLKQ